MSMGSTFNDVPEELLLKIFLLQPMNSLVLLRNVCKLWDQIISSEYFNKFHLARERAFSNTNRYLLLEGSKSSLVDSQRHVYHDIPIKNYECYGICDGLLCLSSTKGKEFSKEHSSIILWSPIFRKVLPPLKIKYSELTYMCFGHHDDDYKVIKIVVFPRMCNVCIYSLSTNSWKIREFDATISFNYNYNNMLVRSWILDYSKGRLLNGIAYFVNYSRIDNRAIISFDLSREIFGELPLGSWYDSNCIMEEFKGSLALIGIRAYLSGMIQVEMHVLRKNNNSFSWDPFFLVKEYSYIQQKPVGFINKDELVIRIITPDARPTYSFYLWNVEDKVQRESLNPPWLPYFSIDSKNFTSLGFNARISSSVELGKYVKPISPPTRRPTRQPTMKEVASISNS